MQTLHLPESILSENQRRSVELILQAALDAVDPYPAVKRVLSLSGNILSCSGSQYDLRQVRRMILLGAGKASAAMAHGVSDVLGDLLESGAIIIKQKTEDVKYLPERVRVLQGSHPKPDEKSVLATDGLLSLAGDLNENDLVICVISGGGSALMSAPARDISWQEMNAFTELLLHSGASIGELNTLRKHLDQVKGGGLLRKLAPARVLALILSDVVGSPLDVIASGPTVADPSTFADAMRLLDQYDLREQTPASILNVLEAGVRGERPETVKPGDPLLKRVSHVLVGSNELASQAALSAAEQAGFHARVLTNSLQGEAREVGTQMAGLLRRLAAGDPMPRPALWIAGGETTVTIRGDGKGGRNQELALSAVTALAGVEDVALVTLATDGEDGPTDAAGAVVTGQTLSRARELGLDPQDALARNDAYRFFDQLGALLRCGSTGTNVNDLTFLFAFPRDQEFLS